MINTGGRECPAPDELTQVETCRLEPCGGAAWRAEEWSVCQPTGGGKCGSGTQVRNIDCVDHMNQTLQDRR